MPVYFFWGADEFRMKKAVRALCDRHVNPDWSSFNYEQIPPEQDAIIQGLNQAMTPPFGMGKRVVWLVDTPVCQRCSADVLTELERTLPNIPDSSILLLTSSNKPDGRLKSTKLLKKYADTREFDTIPPWKTDQIEHQVYQVAKDVGLQLTPAAAALLGEAIGADTRRLYNELEKLKTYWVEPKQALAPEAVTTLVATSTQSSLQLAAALRQGETDRALTLITELLERNEPTLRIVATLVGQFRTWLWVKLMTEAGERDNRAIAQAADVGNPKRIYFLQKEVRNLSSSQLQNALKLLLSLEYELKQGAPETITLHTKVMQLAHCFRPI